MKLKVSLVQLLKCIVYYLRKNVVGKWREYIFPYVKYTLVDLNVKC